MYWLPYLLFGAVVMNPQDMGGVCVGSSSCQCFIEPSGVSYDPNHYCSKMWTCPGNQYDRIYQPGISRLEDCWVERQDCMPTCPCLANHQDNATMICAPAVARL